MDFEEFLEKIRQHHIKQFEAFVEKLKKAHKVGASEVKLRLSGESGIFANLYCVDYIARDYGEEIIEMAPDTVLRFEPISAHLGDMDIAVQSLAWHDVNLKADVVVDEARFSDWFEVWFDPDDRRYDSANLLSNCIHSLNIAGNNVGVDLGTAPVAALIDLLALLEQTGCRSVALA